MSDADEYVKYYVYFKPQSHYLFVQRTFYYFTLRLNIVQWEFQIKFQLITQYLGAVLLMKFLNVCEDESR